MQKQKIARKRQKVRGSIDLEVNLCRVMRNVGLANSTEYENKTILKNNVGHGRLYIFIIGCV